MSEIKDFVPRTSLFMAGMRAIETQRPDRLFEDPFAAKLAGVEILALLEPWKQEYLENRNSVVTVRTRFFDDFLLSLAAKFSQIVILGAGMDTRAFRLPWLSTTHIYELDRPEVLNYKESILNNTLPQSTRYTIAADFQQPWSHLLLAQGYQHDLPSVWLLEGLLYYLSEQEVYQLLQTISALSATGSYLGADLVNLKMLQQPGEFNKHWRCGFDDPETLFAAHGWTASVIQPGDEGAHFHRCTPRPPREVPNVARNFFVTARKEDS